MSKSKYERVPLIYARYSTLRQDELSCAQQERKAREWLKQHNVDDTRAIVITDEAISGKKDKRDGFSRVKQLIENEEVSFLVLDQLSRLTRGYKTVAYIEDCIFHGTRVIAVGDSFDTIDPNWPISSSMRQIVNALERKDIAWRVRRAQESRLVEEHNVSLGENPLGYCSEYADPDWIELLKARKKARKVVKIDPEGAETVRMIYDMYGNRQMSLTSIAKELNRLERPKSKRAQAARRTRALRYAGASEKQAKWDCSLVSQILSNKKYGEKWEYGRLTRIEDSEGNVRVVPAPATQIVEATRADLHIIGEELWKKTQKRRAEQREIWLKAYGRTEGRQNTGLHPRDRAPRHNLSGILRCGVCNRRMRLVISSVPQTYFFCPAHAPGGCTMGKHVRISYLDAVFYEHVSKLCLSLPEWLPEVEKGIADGIAEHQSQQPAQRDRLKNSLAEVEQQIANLLNAMSRMNSGTESLVSKLAQLEQQKQHILLDLQDLPEELGTMVIPDRVTVQAWLQQLPELLATPSCETRECLKAIFPEMLAEEVTPGVKFGETRIRVRLDPSQVIVQASGGKWTKQMASVFSNGSENSSLDEHWAEFLVFRSTNWRKYGPLVEKMRQEGVIWTEIAKRLGRSEGAVWSWHKDYKRHQSQNN